MKVPCPCFTPCFHAPTYLSPLAHAGRKYVGQYKDHKKHGQGTYKYANGDEYVGEWKKAKYDGQGTYAYANGDKYVGAWKQGVKQLLKRQTR